MFGGLDKHVVVSSPRQNHHHNHHNRFHNQQPTANCQLPTANQNQTKPNQTKTKTKTKTKTQTQTKLTKPNQPTCRPYTSHVTFSVHNARVRFLCCTTHWLQCLHECISPHLHGHPRCAVVRSLIPLFLALFFSVCFSYLFFFYLNPEVNLFLHVVVIGATYHWHSAKRGVWP